MERRTQIIIGVAVAVLVIGGIIGVVLVRRNALERQLQGSGPKPVTSGSTTTGGTTGTPGAPEGPKKIPPPPGAAMPGNSDVNAPYVPPANPPVNPVDADGDGLSDTDETNVYHTDPHNRDTDGDGIGDGDEVLYLHTDPLTKNAPPARH